MSIELHCTHCNKLIRAPESAGGKHGKCPYCKQSVYIPTPVTDDDVIPMAPVDEEAERRADELRKESIAISASVDKDKAGKYATSGATPRGAPETPRRAEEDAVDVAEQVRAFVLAMRDSRLEDAAQVVTTLRRVRKAARDHIETILTDQMPTPIADVPVPLMKGFLNELLGRVQ